MTRPLDAVYKRTVEPNDQRTYPLRQQRERSGLTLSEVARRAGVSKGLLSLWEREQYTGFSEAQRRAVLAVIDGAKPEAAA